MPAPFLDPMCPVLTEFKSAGGQELYSPLLGAIINIPIDTPLFEAG